MELGPELLSLRLAVWQVGGMAFAAQLVACDIHPLNNLRVLRYLETSLHQDEASRLAWYRHWIATGFEAAERYSVSFAHDGPYAFGKDVTLADAMLVPQMYNARRFEVPLDEFPRLVAVADAVNSVEMTSRKIAEARVTSLFAPFLGELEVGGGTHSDESAPDAD